MLESPMCCPNPVHNNESDFNAGMDIIPGEGTNDWFCLDCRKTFTHNKGVSTLKREPYERREAW